MEPDQRFAGLDKRFWANIRTISQAVGYSRAGSVTVPALAQVESAYKDLGLTSTHIADDGELTEFGAKALEYLEYRANVLNDNVRPLLMDAKAAKNLFNTTKKRLKPGCPLPMNKQKGDKKTNAYLTGLINMTIEASIGGEECDYDPKELTTFTRGGVPVRTLARRVDGAFPTAVNPVAVWEIKEYYYTTSFGSRVSGGVYETLLDGLELEELRSNEDIAVHHYLFVDAYGTWWDKGKSYLCRMIDMLHMGFVDEVLFGKEVVERLPILASSWLAELEARQTP